MQQLLHGELLKIRSHRNILGVTDLVLNDTNKIPEGMLFNPEGATGERYDALELNLDDKDLLKLRDEWEMR